MTETEEDSGGLVRAIKARAGRLLVQTSLLFRGVRPTGLARVWEYTDDCAGMPGLPPPDARQDPTHVMRGLTARPWHDPGARFEWLSALEAATGPIRDQVDALGRESGFGDDLGSVVPPPWTVHFLRCLGEDVERPSHPAVTAALDAVPRPASTGLCYLARLEPHSETECVTGPTNTRLRIHLGIDVPAEGSDCGLEVAGETRRWRGGRCLVFDDSFPHRAWNHTARPVVLLVVDVWHPDISDHEAVGLEAFMRLSPKSVKDRQAVRAGLA